MLTSDSVDLLRMAWEAMIQGPEFSQIQALYAADQKGPVTLVGDRKSCGGLTSEDSSLLGETLIKYIKQVNDHFFHKNKNNTLFTWTLYLKIGFEIKTITTPKNYQHEISK